MAHALAKPCTAANACIHSDFVCKPVPHHIQYRLVPNRQYFVVPRNQPRLVRQQASSSLTQSDGSVSVSETRDVPASEHNGSTTPTSDARDEQTAPPSWGETPAPEEDWQGSKPLTLKDIDWGLTGLLGVILLLSFGAYRVLDHFRVYRHSSRPSSPRITTVVEHQSAASSSLPSKSKGSKGRSRQDKSSRSTSSGDKAAAATATGSVPEAVAAAGSGSLPSPAAEQAATGSSSQQAAAEPAAPNSAFDIGAPVPNFGLPPAGVPGAPQPSPVDAGFSSSLPAPWADGGLGQLDFTPAPLPEGVTQPPELPSIHVEPPAKAVTRGELATMPSDPSLPSLRERAHIAMRASGAAMEASQRAAAYSAAASSAASRAAEAAEQAAVAASAVQSALEAAAEDAMAEAVKRMNRAVEMVADAESRAAAAAAMATAYQDISDDQAAAASTAADLPARPERQAQQGHIANLRQKLHEQMFSAGGVLADWVAGVWAAIVGAVTWVQLSIAAAWAGVVGAVASCVKGGSG